jgi:hypothetical protein
MICFIATNVQLYFYPAVQIQYKNLFQYLPVEAVAPPERHQGLEAGLALLVFQTLVVLMRILQDNVCHLSHTSQEYLLCQ